MSTNPSVASRQIAADACDSQDVHAWFLDPLEYQQLYHYTVRKIRSSEPAAWHTAFDIVQEAILRFIESMGEGFHLYKSRPRQNPRAWMYRTISNIIHEHRRGRRETSILTNRHGRSMRRRSRGSTSSKNLLLHQLQKAKLTEKQFEAIKIVACEGTIRAGARKLGITTQALSDRLQRAADNMNPVTSAAHPPRPTRTKLSNIPRSLPPKWRESLQMFSRGMSYSEIARALGGMSRSAARSLVRRARRRLPKK